MTPLYDAIGASYGHTRCADPTIAVMLAQAAAKAANVAWLRGRADALPFPDCTFDGVVCTLAIHHFPELQRPFRELGRVLDRGRFIIFTSFREQMRRYWLNHYFPEMMRRSMKKMPGRDSVVTALRGAGFVVEDTVPFHVSPRLQDLFLYSGKERPELYLDPSVRANISSFATLCDADELQAGLATLRADLESSRFTEVAQHHVSLEGDYAYVVARKEPA